MRFDRRGWVILAASAVLGAGCVDRRFVVETNVPGAQVYVNDHPIGPSPADTAFEYPGRYEFRAIAPGYDPLSVRENVRSRWYDIPGLDFFAEVVWPGRIEDVRRIQLTLTPARQVNTQELLGAAENLRVRAQTLPPPSVPDEAPVPATTPRPVVIPPDTPPPAAGPPLPSLGPPPTGPGTQLR